MKFQYYIDTKCSIWQRAHYEIEAASLEEARAIAIEEAKAQSLVGFQENEFLYDTEEDLTPEENGGSPTVEMFVEGDPTGYVYTNCEPQKAEA